MSDADLLLIGSALREIERHLGAQPVCAQVAEWRAEASKYTRAAEEWAASKLTPAQSDAMLESVMDLLVEVSKASTRATAPPPQATTTAAPPGFESSEAVAAATRGAQLQARMRQPLPPGMRLEVGEPACIEVTGRDALWVCLAKIKGPRLGELEPADMDEEAEVTETVFVVTGTGRNRDEAFRDVEDKVVRHSTTGPRVKK